jgi:hypothetical protein
MSEMKLGIIMRCTLILFMLVLVSCSESSVDKVTTVTPFERAGHYDLIIKRSKKDPSNPMFAGSLTAETIVGVNVLSVNQDSMSLEWTYGRSVIVDDHDGTLSAEEQKEINMYEGLKFQLIVKGSKHIHIKNYTLISGQLEQIFLNLYGNDSIAGKSDMYARVKKMFQRKASSPGLLLANFFPEISLLFSSIGEEFVAGNNMMLDSIGNPYGEGYMDILTTVQINQEKEEVLISKCDSVPQDILDDKIMQYLEKIYGPAAASIPKSQIPQSTYVVKLGIELSKEHRVLSVVDKKLLNKGEYSMINVLEVIVD